MIDGVWTIFRRELTASSRHPRFFARRIAVVTVLALAVSGVFLRTFYIEGFDAELDPSRMRLAALQGFGISVSVGLIWILGLIPSIASAAFAREREKLTFESLLTTGLSAFEIVFGKFAKNMAFAMLLLASTLPVVVILERLGGVDPRFALLAAAGLAATGFMLIGLAVLISVWTRAEKPARGLAVLCAVFWFETPFMAAMIGPKLLPGLYAWVGPVNRVLLQSGPLSVMAYLMGAAPGTSLSAVVWRMVGWESAAGLAMLALAVATLRPAGRLLAGDGGVFWTRRGRKPSTRRRPECGDDPMQWKERYTSKNGRLADLMSLGIYGSVLVLLGFVAYSTSKPVIREMVQARPGASASAASYAERSSYNQVFLRPVTGVCLFIIPMVISGLTSEAFDLERKRSTWLVLLSTPLSGESILRAKQNAATRRVAPLLFGLAGLWAYGAILGSVHPLGLVTAGAALAASVWFARALGAYSTVRAAEGTPGSNFALVISLLSMLLPPVAFYLTGRAEAAPLASVSPPFLAILAVLNRSDVLAVFGQAGFEGVTVAGIEATPGGAYWVVATTLLGPAVMCLLSAWMDREAIRQFDSSVGRPTRPTVRAEALTHAPAAA